MAESILVPVDDSRCSRAALEYAAREHDDPSLHLLHVHDYAGAARGGTGMLPSDWVAWYENARDEAESLVSEAADRTRRHGAHAVETEVTVGRPARSIVAYAEDRDVDQIVIGTHGRSGLTRLLHGSVSERVLRSASVPVTVVR